MGPSKFAYEHDEGWCFGICLFANQRTYCPNLRLFLAIGLFLRFVLTNSSKQNGQIRHAADSPSSKSTVPLNHPGLIVAREIPYARRLPAHSPRHASSLFRAIAMAFILAPCFGHIIHPHSTRKWTYVAYIVYTTELYPFEHNILHTNASHARD